MLSKHLLYLTRAIQDQNFYNILTAIQSNYSCKSNADVFQKSKDFQFALSDYAFLAC